jgi:RNA polymerase sigma-70 factor (ECF subfamily)
MTISMNPPFAQRPEPRSTADNRLDIEKQDSSFATVSETATLAVESDEQELVGRLRAGDARAFEQMVRAYGGRMRTTARRLLNCDEEANDALQEAFFSAFKNMSHFEGTSRLSTWLHRIAINAALMKLRSRRRRNEVSIESLLPTFAPDGHRHNPREAWAAPTDEILERQETCRMIRDRIDQLPDEHRTVLMLRDIEELDTTETATVLGISSGAVKTRLHRARMALRQFLEAELAH